MNVTYVITANTTIMIVVRTCLHISTESNCNTGVADFARKFWRLFLTLSRPGLTEEGLAMSFLWSKGADNWRGGEFCCKALLSQ
jgi:hypothetical protein